MLDRSWVGYPRPSWTECLLAFLGLFIASCFWVISIRWPMMYRKEDAAMERG